MDPELLALLQRLSDESGLNPLTDEELAQLRAGLAAVGDDITAATATTEDIELLAEAAAALAVVDEELAVRQAAATERETEAAALLAQLRGEGEGGGEGNEPGDQGGEGEGTGAGASGEGEGGEPAGAEGAGAEGAGGQEEPIAASGGPGGGQARRLPSMSRLAARRPARSAPRRTQTDAWESRPVLTASADLPGVPSGIEIDLDRWAEAAEHKIKSVRQVRTPGNDGEKVYLGKISNDYPTDRRLTGNPTQDQRILESVVGREALVASGGVCGPVAVDYNITTLAVADRPVKQALAQFQASRGGVRYILPHTLAQVTGDGPAALWTESTDVNPGGTTKAHATFVCQAVQEAYVDSVTSIVQFGNFQARYFPEQIQQYMDTAEAVHSRLAEATLLAAISTGSTATTYGEAAIGATRDLLACIDRAASAYRYRNRMAIGSKLRLILPYYVCDMIRTDLARNMPGDSGGQSERLAVADSEIQSWFDVRNINITWTLDSFTGAGTFQGFTAQGAGQLMPWPSTTYGWLFHEGAWMFLDGGELNLGMVRDSVLNKTNDFQFFSETFEKAIFRGHETIQLAMKIDPIGATVGTVSPVAGGTETVGS